MLFVNKIKNFTNTKKILSEEEFKINISKGFRYEVSKNKFDKFYKNYLRNEAKRK